MAARNLMAVIAVASAAAAACLGPARAAHGGVFAGLNYDHTCGVGMPGPNGQTTASAELSGSTLPVQQTNAPALRNVSGSAIYTFTDDGTTASLRVDRQGQISGTYCQVGEGADDTFTLSQPSSFTATITTTGSGNSQLTLDSPNFQYDFQIGVLTPGTKTYSGMLPASVPFTLDESWNIDNEYTGAPLNPSGTSSLSFVLTTAVPEPVPGAAVAAAGVALLSRRRRVRL